MAVTFNPPHNVDLPQEIRFVRCKRHPKYKADKPPRSNCARCWRIYDAASVNKVIFGLKAMMGELQSMEDRAIGTINREASSIFREAFAASLKIVKEQAKEYINNNFLANSEHARVNFGLGSNDGGKL